MFFGTASMIDGLVRKMKKEIGLETRVVLTEGEASIVKKYLEEEVIYDRHLVMDGLRLVYTIRINSIKESPHHIMIGVIVIMKDKGSADVQYGELTSG